MPEAVRGSPVPEDVLAVAGHCCSVRLTRLPELEDGIDFTPAAAARADFERLLAAAAGLDDGSRAAGTPRPGCPCSDKAAIGTRGG